MFLKSLSYDVTLGNKLNTLKITVKKLAILPITNIICIDKNVVDVKSYIKSTDCFPVKSNMYNNQQYYAFNYIIILY